MSDKGFCWFGLTGAKTPGSCPAVLSSMARHRTKRSGARETGVDARLLGVAGVYFNATRSGIVIVFRGQAVGGRPRTSPEVKEAAFVDLTPDTVERYIKRPQALCRVLDAMQVKPVPYEAYDVRPYRPIERMGG